MICVHKKLHKSVSQVAVSSSFQDVTLLEVRRCGGDKLLLGCIYRSPNSTDVNDGEMYELLRSVSGNLYSHICLLGDFNTHQVDQELHTTNKSENSHEALFLETIQDCFFHQHVDQPTRSQGTDMPSLLDLIFTNEQHMISDIQYQAPIGSSDHSVLVFNSHCYVNVPNDGKKINYNAGDYDGMRTSLEGSKWLHNFGVAAETLITAESWKMIK